MHKYHIERIRDFLVIVAIEVDFYLLTVPRHFINSVVIIIITFIFIIIQYTVSYDNITLHTI